MKQRHAALYVRVSGGEQHTEMQERALREYAERRAWVVHKTYRDRCTGATASRPGLDELLKDCQSSVNCKCQRKHTVDTLNPQPA